MPNKIKDQNAKIKAKTKSSKTVITEGVKKHKTVVVMKAETRVEMKTDGKPAKKINLTADVFDSKGKVVESMKLPEEVFGAKINNNLMAQAVRVYLANQRQGTVSTKTRGEVQGSTRKIYRQKGTGRARHGGIRAPIFVHGGIAFGPKPRDYSLKLPKKMKKLALFSALSLKLKDNQVKILSNISKIEAKTKAMVDVLKNLKANGKNKKILLVIPNILDNVLRASRNIEGIETIEANKLNTYEVLNNKSLFFMKESIDVIEKHFGGEK